MNFNGNKVIPAALFAATASIAVSAAPAHALDLTGHIAFNGAVDITENTNGSDYYFDFGDSNPNAFTTGCSGSFICDNNVGGLADLIIYPYPSTSHHIR